MADNRPALLYVGRVSNEKGLDLLPPLSRRLHAMRCEHRFIIAGDGPMVPALKRDMPDAVFTGTLSREPVAVAFASSDLFVFPSRTDTAGNVVLEAQASGVPVVISGEGGPRENILAGTTGLVCHTASPDQWATAVAGLLRDRARHAAMAHAAREYASPRRWSEALQPLYQAYRDVREGAVTTAPGDVLPLPVR